ncbi:hypothetical protein BGZ82_000181, partial [Podila clonocystis]
FTLPAPPITFTVKRKAFVNEDSTNKVEFQGSCADGTLFVIWDRARVTLSKETKALIKLLKPSDQVEVTGKWSAWINSKTAKHRLSFLLEGIEAKEPSEEDDDLDLPKEREFNFEESDDSLMLKALTYQSDLAKLERRAEGRSNDVRKIIKRSKLSHPSDNDDGEQEVSPGHAPSSSSAGASSSSSAGGPPSSSAGGPPAPKPARTRIDFVKSSGTHTKFGENGMDMS